MTEFQSPECAAAAALGSSEELRDQRYLVCPSLTPGHLRSWAQETTTEMEEVAVEGSFSNNTITENNPLVSRLFEMDYVGAKPFKVKVNLHVG